MSRIRIKSIDANPFPHSMVEDAKAFGHRMLKGVGDSICSNPKNVFVAENADKVGAASEKLFAAN